MPYQYHERGDNTEISATGPDTLSAFIEGARAVADLCVDINTVKGKERVKLVVEARDLSALLTSWLQEVTLRAKENNLLFGEFEIGAIQKVNDTQYLLTGAAWGEPFEEGRHVLKRSKGEISIQEASFKEESGGCSCHIRVK